MKLEVPIKVDIYDVTKLIHDLQCLQTYKLGVNDTTVLVSLDAVVGVFTDYIRAKRLGKDTNIPAKWIPVSERLPEKTGIYIVTGKTFISSNNFPNDFYRSTQVHKYSEKTGWDTFFSDEIFAWMPLPEPWEGEQHETD